MVSSSAIAASKSLIVGSAIDLADVAPPLGARSLLDFRHRRAERAAFERHVHFVTWFERRCLTNDTRSGSVPCNRVTAAEHGKGAQPLDTGRQRTETVLQGRDPAPHRGLEPTIACDEASANRAKAVTRIEGVKRATKQIVPPRPAHDRLVHALPQRCRELGYVTAPHRDAAAITGVAGPRFKHMQPCFHPPQAMMNRRVEALADPVDVAEEFVLAPDHELGRR